MKVSLNNLKTLLIICTVVTGLQRETTIMVQEQQGKLYITVNIHGSFGTGGQRYADQILAEFKGKLQERLKI